MSRSQPRRVFNSSMPNYSSVLFTEIRYFLWLISLWFNGITRIFMDRYNDAYAILGSFPTLMHNIFVSSMQISKFASS